MVWLVEAIVLITLYVPIFTTKLFEASYLTKLFVVFLAGPW